MSIIAFWLRGASNNAPLPTDRVKIFKQFQKEKTSKANIREHHTKSIQREWNKKPIMKIYFFCRKFRMLRKRFLKMIFEALWAKLLWDERLTLSKIRTRTCINNHRLDPIGEYSGKYYYTPYLGKNTKNYYPIGCPDILDSLDKFSASCVQKKILTH